MRRVCHLERTPWSDSKGRVSAQRQLVDVSARRIKRGEVGCHEGTLVAVGRHVSGWLLVARRGRRRLWWDRECGAGAERWERGVMRRRRHVHPDVTSRRVGRCGVRLGEPTQPLRALTASRLQSPPVQAMFSISKSATDTAYVRADAEQRGDVCRGAWGVSRRDAHCRNPVTSQRSRLSRVAPAF